MKKILSNKIKIVIISALVLLINKADVFSQSDSLYQNIKLGNEAYNKSEFEKAIDYYKSVYDKGYTSAELNYNIANSYYRLKNYKNAILFYEKAKLLSPDDENIITNLEQANKYTQDKIEIIPDFFMIKWLKGFINMFSVSLWAWISIVSFILLLSLILVFLFSTKIGFRKMSFYFSVILVFTTIISFISASKQNNKLNKHKTAIVFSPSVTVKSSPNENATDLFIIHEGLKVTISDRLENWSEIQLSDGRVGWLQNETVEDI